MDVYEVILMKWEPHTRDFSRGRFRLARRLLNVCVAVWMANISAYLLKMRRILA